MRVSFASLPGRAERANEDFIAATPQAIVLLDGAGMPDAAQTGCVHGVAWFARNLGVRILDALTIEPAIDLRAALRDAIKQTADRHATTCNLDHPGSPSATVVMVRDNGTTMDYLVLCDSVLILDRPGGPVAVTDERLERLAQSRRPSRDPQAVGTSSRAEAERHYVESLRDYRNREGGYWVASAQPEAADQAMTNSLPNDQVRRLAVLSDGASRPVDLFQQATWKDTLDLLTTGGPSSLLSRVREMESSDQDGERWPRGKCHDDATAALAYLS